MLMNQTWTWDHQSLNWTITASQTVSKVRIFTSPRWWRGRERELGLRAPEVWPVEHVFSKGKMLITNCFNCTYHHILSHCKYLLSNVCMLYWKYKKRCHLCNINKILLLNYSVWHQNIDILNHFFPVLNKNVFSKYVDAW